MDCIDIYDPAVITGLARKNAYLSVFLPPRIYVPLNPSQLRGSFASIFIPARARVLWTPVRERDDRIRPISTWTRKTAPIDTSRLLIAPSCVPYMGVRKSREREELSGSRLGRLLLLIAPLWAFVKRPLQSHSKL